MENLKHRASKVGHPPKTFETQTPADIGIF